MLGDLATHLADSGRYKCTVLAGSTVRTTHRWNRLPIRLESVRIRRVRTLSSGKRTFLHRIFEYSTFYLGVASYLFFRRDFDVVVCFTTPPLIGFAAAAGLALSRIPFIYYVQDLYPELLYDMGFIRDPWLIRKLSVLNRIIVRRATRVVTIGRWMARKIERNYGFRRGSVPILHNWAMGIEPSSPPTDGPFVILYTGNIGLAHDFSLLPRLLEELAKLDPSDLRFCFVGDGKRFRAVQKLFPRSLRDRCEFSGYVEREELNSLLSQANLFLVAQSERTVGDIVPSKFYGYLAAGRPIVFLGSSKSEIGDIIVRNRIGVVVECPEDGAVGAQHIARMAKRDGAYLKVCERAASIYREELGFERSASGFEALLQEVVGR